MSGNRSAEPKGGEADNARKSTIEDADTPRKVDMDVDKEDNKKAKNDKNEDEDMEGDNESDGIIELDKKVEKIKGPGRSSDADKDMDLDDDESAKKDKQSTKASNSNSIHDDDDDKKRRAASTPSSNTRNGKLNNSSSSVSKTQQHQQQHDDDDDDDDSFVSESEKRRGVSSERDNDSTPLGSETAMHVAATPAISKTKQSINANLWTHIWPALQKLGWRYHTRNAQGKWSYAKPNSIKNSKNRAGITVFETIDLAIDHISKEDPEIYKNAMTKLAKDPKFKDVSTPASSLTSAAATSTALSTPVVATAPQSASGSASFFTPVTSTSTSTRKSAGANPSNFQPHRGDPSKITPMNVYTEVIDYLKYQGWKVVRGNGMIDWFYLAPGVTVKSGKLNVDMFDSVLGLIYHVIDHDSMKEIVDGAFDRLGITLEQFTKLHPRPTVTSPVLYRHANEKAHSTPKISSTPAKKDELAATSTAKNTTLEQASNTKSQIASTGRKRGRMEKLIEKSDTKPKNEIKNDKDDDEEDIISLPEQPKKQQRTKEKNDEVSQSVVTPIAELDNKTSSLPTATPVAQSPQKESLSQATTVTQDSRSSKVVTVLSVNDVEPTGIFKEMVFDVSSLQSDYLSPDSPTQSELQSLIVKHGGIIVASLDKKDASQTGNDEDKSLVVYSVSAPMNYRTPRYLQYVAKKIPVLHFSWILLSVSEKKLLPWNQYILPAGLSLIQDSFFFPSEWTSFIQAAVLPSYPVAIPIKKRVLNGVKCALVLYGRTEVAVKTLLLEAGATVVHLDQADQTTSFAICDASDSSKTTIDTCKRLSSLGASIVSLDWVTMTIVDNVVHDPKIKDMIKATCTYGNSEWPLLESEVASKVIQNTSGPVIAQNPASMKAESWIGPPREITSDKRTKYYTCMVKGSRMDEGDYVRILVKNRLHEVEGLDMNGAYEVNFFGTPSHNDETFVKFGRIHELFENAKGDYRAYIQEYEVSDPGSESLSTKLKANGCFIDIPLSMILGKFVCIREQDSQMLKYTTSQIYWRQRVFIISQDSISRMS